MNIRLPFVIWKNCIVPLLTFKSLVRLRGVCKFFRERFPITAIPDPWVTDKAMQLFGENLEEMCTYWDKNLPVSLKKLTLSGDANLDLRYLTNLQSLKLTQSNYGAVWVPTSLTQLRSNYVMIKNKEMPNLREASLVRYENAYPVTKLDVIRIDMFIHHNIVKLSMLANQDKDFRYLPNLRSVEIRSASQRGITLWFPPLKKFAVYDEVRINFDTSRLKHVKMRRCFYPQLLVSSLKTLAMPRTEKELDFLLFPNLTKYTVYTNSGERPKLENIRKLSYKFQSTEGTNSTTMRITRDSSIVTSMEIILPIALKFEDVSIPPSVRQLSLTGYHGKLPVLPNLYKLALYESVPRRLPFYVHKLDLHFVFCVDLSRIAVHKLRMAYCGINHLPRDVAIIKYVDSSFPNTRGLDLCCG